MYIRELTVVISILTLLFCGCETTPEAPAGRSKGEMSPVFEASEVLAKEILRGPNYRIAGRVPVEQYQYVFTVKSDFGTINARGRDMLYLRIRELKSIEAARKLSKDPHLVDGILAPLEDTEKGLKLIITEPLETLDSAPRGFDLMVNQYTDPADRRAGSPERRKLATKLDCDPETTNPVLKKLLDEMTLELFGGSLLTQAAMSFVPGLSVPATTAQMKELINKSPPSVINDELDSELEAAGVEKPVRSRFHYSRAFTTIQRLQLMNQFRALDGIQNRAALIKSAAEAYSEVGALCCIREGKMLVDIRQRKTVRQLKFIGLPLAVLENGTHVLVCPYDYVTNTREVIDSVDEYRASNPNVTTVLLTAGRVSPAASKTIKSANIRIIEEGTPDW